MNAQRLALTVFSAMLATFLSGCSGGGGGGSRGGPVNVGHGRQGAGDTQKRDGTKTSVGVPARARVWLDNYALTPCTVTMDGEAKGTLEPFGSRFLEIPAGGHTFVLSNEGQATETLTAEIPAGKLALIRPAGAGAYRLTTLEDTSAVGEKTVRTFNERPAPSEGVVLAEYGPFETFPSPSSGTGETAGEPATRVTRIPPGDLGLAGLEHYICSDYRLYGLKEAENHRASIASRLEKMAAQETGDAFNDLLIRVADRLGVCAVDNRGAESAGEAIRPYLSPPQERIPDEQLLTWAGLDGKTGKPKAVADGQRINPPVAAIACTLLQQRGKHQAVVDVFADLTEGAACGVLQALAHPPLPEELRRHLLVLALGRSEKSVLQEASAALADKDFIPDEKMVEALTATIEGLDAGNDSDRATILSSSSALVDAFYRHPAVVARPATRTFLVRFADPMLEPTLDNARHALIDGRCAGDLVPIYTHFTRDVRIEMVGRMLNVCRKREAVGPDIVELHRVALADEDTDVRVAAAQALPQFAAYLTQENLPAFQDLLVRALSDPSADVQREAARALEVDGFVPTEQIADQLVTDWQLLDGTDPQGQADRAQLAKSLKTSFEKNPAEDADREWRQRVLEALAGNP